MSLTWLLFRGHREWGKQHAEDAPFQLDEANLALGIECVINSDDPELMAKALWAIRYGLVRPRTKSRFGYWLTVVSPNRGPKEDFNALEKNRRKRVAISASVYRRQIFDKGRMKRAVAEAEIEFSLSRAAVYRAIRLAKADLILALEAKYPPEERFYFAQFMGFVQGETYNPAQDLLSHDFEKWLYGFAFDTSEDD